MISLRIYFFLNTFTIFIPNERSKVRCLPKNNVGMLTTIDWRDRTKNNYCCSRIDCNKLKKRRINDKGKSGKRFYQSFIALHCLLSSCSFTLCSYLVAWCDILSYIHISLYSWNDAKCCITHKADSRTVAHLFSLSVCVYFQKFFQLAKLVQ